MSIIDPFPHIPDRVAVLGANGQVGRAITTLLGPKAIPLAREKADLSRPDTLLKLLDRMKPDLLINAAAYTAVDKAEEEEPLALIINGETPGLLAEWCHDRAIPFVHYSMDYVFSGEGATAHTEDDSAWPLSAYGRTKRAGEETTEQEGGKWFIFRTSWVYDAFGANFLNTMIRLGREREELRIVEDQHGAPTYAPDLAEATIAILEKALQMDVFPSGIYHLCGAGETTWKQFADAIFAEAARFHIPMKTARVLGIPSEDYPTPAIRPRNSRLSMEEVNSAFGVSLPDWRQSLSDAMALKAEQFKRMN